MKFLSPLIVVENIERSKKFYREVLGLKIRADFGANVTLTGGVALQTKDSWKTFIHKQNDEIIFSANASELYFEEDDFDGFLTKLNAIDNIDYVHTVHEHAWGQRAVRFYDPDKHIIEVGENLDMVIQRFLNSGLCVQETAERMDVPVKFVESAAARLSRVK